MRNPYKKFQNSSSHGFKVMLCIEKRDERTDGWTEGRTNNPEAICPANFFEVGGINIKKKMDVQVDLSACQLKGKIHFKGGNCNGR